ncbi:MAG: PRTRC system protein C [bacterium]|jgi:PRTRC genetic system protein C
MSTAQATALQVKPVKRTFKYAGITLPDPDPKLSEDEVRQMYSATYPELATAVVEGPDYQANGTAVYSLRKAAGAKG